MNWKECILWWRSKGIVLGRTKPRRGYSRYYIKKLHSREHRRTYFEAYHKSGVIEITELLQEHFK